MPGNPEDGAANARVRGVRGADGRRNRSESLSSTSVTSAISYEGELRWGRERSPSRSRSAAGRSPSPADADVVPAGQASQVVGRGSSKKIYGPMQGRSSPRPGERDERTADAAGRAGSPLRPAEARSRRPFAPFAPPRRSLRPQDLWTPERVAIWRAEARETGPFADGAPPYQAPPRVPRPVLPEGGALSPPAMQRNAVPRPPDGREGPALPAVLRNGEVVQSAKKAAVNRLSAQEVEMRPSRLGSFGPFPLRQSRIPARSGSPAHRAAPPGSAGGTPLLAGGQPPTAGAAAAAALSSRSSQASTASHRTFLSKLLGTGPVPRATGTIDKP